jgi:hypothetical protein
MDRFCQLMYRRLNASIFGVAAVACAIMFLSSAARAGVSVDDGYGPDGLPQQHFELDPYVWLPATNAKIRLGNGASADISQGVPSPSDLVSKLNGAFLGFGLARYGAFSVELDIDYVSATETKGLGPNFLTVSRSLKLDTSLFRISPGFGYEVFRGDVGTVPATLDARAGFSFTDPSATLTFTRTNLAGVTNQFGASGGGGFVQPWLGGRVAIYPWPDWRFSLDAAAQGFGVNGGSWGWQVGAYVTWSANSWLNLIAGYRALNTERIGDSTQALRTLNITAYGPVLAVGFSF